MQDSSRRRACLKVYDEPASGGNSSAGSSYTQCSHGGRRERRIRSDGGVLAAAAQGDGPQVVRLFTFPLSVYSPFHVFQTHFHVCRPHIHVCRTHVLMCVEHTLNDSSRKVDAATQGVSPQLLKVMGRIFNPAKRDRKASEPCRKVDVRLP